MKIGVIMRRGDLEYCAEERITDCTSAKDVYNAVNAMGRLVAKALPDMEIGTCVAAEDGEDADLTDSVGLQYEYYRKIHYR